MCGIVGAAGEVDPFRAGFVRALDLLVHRGPDSSGVHAEEQLLFGHRRLAIIDLSDAAHQPMIDEDTGNILIFNGEIYNYLELRSELEGRGVHFRSNSDTEVLLKAWAHWGPDMFGRLNGMWAFALWIPSQRELILSRDRFGVKPLYWAIGGKALLFASEPKALIALDPRLAEPDPVSIGALWFDARSQMGEQSYYRHIRALPAGTWARVRLPDLAVQPVHHWHYPDPEPQSMSPAEQADMFEFLFRDSVKLRLRSDVPVGISLSGGLDSSAILSAAQGSDSGGPAGTAGSLMCFTAVYGVDRGEEAWARLAADTFGAPLESVEAVVSDWPATLERIIWHMDGPNHTPAVFPVWHIMKRAREAGVPVLLEGQGGDEILGGYTYHVAHALIAKLAGALRAEVPARDLLGALRALLGMCGARSGATWLAWVLLGASRDALGPRMQRVDMAEELHAAYLASPVSARGRAVAGDLFGSLKDDHSHDILPGLLHYGDTISMAHGVESRLPFMDYRLVEWVFRTRPTLVEQGDSKYPLRAFLRRSGLPRIAERRDKIGFANPISSFLQLPVGCEMFESLLGAANAPLWAYFDREGARKLARRALDGNASAHFNCYKLLTIGLWLQSLGGAAPLAAVSQDPRRDLQPV